MKRENFHITDNFTYKEVTHSDIADTCNIENEPNDVQLANIKAFLVNVMEKLREGTKSRYSFTSCFRSKKLNSHPKMGGASNSDHMADNNSAAGDIYPLDTDFKTAFEYIRKNLVHDQLIWEGGTLSKPKWIHVSYRNKGKNRMQVLRMIESKLPNGKISKQYVKF